MIDIEKLRAGIALLPELRKTLQSAKNIAEMYGTDNSETIAHFSTLVAALEATATLQPGEGWKMVRENVIIGTCNILDTAKVDLGNQWSEWDQSIRDGLSAALASPVIPSAGGEDKALAMEAKGQALLDALMVRFPDLKEHPDLIHSNDIGKGLLRAIREFHLAWADFGAARILKMPDAEAIAALQEQKP